MLDYRFKRVADNRLIWAQDFISDAHHKWNEILQYSNLSEQMRELMLHSMVKSGVFYSGVINDAPADDQPNLGDLSLGGDGWKTAFFTGPLPVILRGKGGLVVDYGAPDHVKYSPEFLRNIIDVGDPPDGTSTRLLSPDSPETWDERSDLVFLELFTVLLSSGEKHKTSGDAGGVDGRTVIMYEKATYWRIRVIQGIDFDTYPVGITDPVVFAQGYSGTVTDYSYTICEDDDNLYIAGDGSETAKAVLGTTDGYVYAIPLFKIDRMNSALYDSVSNPNGGAKYAATELTYACSSEETYLSLNSTVDMLPGYTLLVNDTTEVVIQSVDSDTQVSLTAPIGASYPEGSPVVTVRDNPNEHFSNVIYLSDITKLNAGVVLKIDASTLGGHEPGTNPGNVLVLNDDGNVPEENLPESITNADTVDYHHAGNGPNEVLVLDEDGLVPEANLPAGSGGSNADTVDYHHAGNGPDEVLVLDEDGLVPVYNLPPFLVGRFVFCVYDTDDKDGFEYLNGLTADNQAFKKFCTEVETVSNDSVVFVISTFENNSFPDYTIVYGKYAVSVRAKTSIDAGTVVCNMTVQALNDAATPVYVDLISTDFKGSDFSNGTSEYSMLYTAFELKSTLSSGNCIDPPQLRLIFTAKGSITNGVKISVDMITLSLIDPSVAI